MTGTPDNRRTLFTKKMIRTAFLQLLQEKELSKITVTDIAKTADVNRGTFYKYYRDPYDLFQQIENGFITEILTSIQTPKDELGIWLQNLLTILKKNRQLSILILSNQTNDQLLSTLLEEVRPEALSRFKELFPRATASDLELYFTYFVSGSLGLIEEWLKEFPEKEPQEIALLMNNVFSTTINER